MSAAAGTGAGGVVVVGFGVTGQAVARYLLAGGVAATVVEDHPTDQGRRRAAQLGVTLVERPDEAGLRRLLEGCRLVIPSPGVALCHPIYRLAGDVNVPVRSEIELGWQHLAERAGDRPPVLVAVTGTNGKTTVTSLVAAMLAASGSSAVAAGNIGLPFIDAVGLGTDVIVAEVSSFQLQFTRAFRPLVSCWLNLAPDHLDWHPDMAHYASAKARIWAAQTGGDVAVVNADDPSVMTAARQVPAGVRVVTFSSTGDADFAVQRQSGRPDRLIGPDGLDLLGIDELPRQLPLDIANGLAAVASALMAGATIEGCREGLRQFTGLPHRLELVVEADGVRWYDDSKATTPASVLAALAGFESVVLIAGGRNKGLDLSVLGRAVPPVHAVVAIGEAAGEIEAAFGDQVPVVVASAMAGAVEAAEGLARPGDTVLLSPGCASFDWYRSYAERGGDFAGAVAARVGNRVGNEGSTL